MCVYTKKVDGIIFLMYNIDRKKCVYTQKRMLNMKIVRERYLEKLVNLKDNGKVKIITGIRRSGKSYLLKELYKDYLIYF